MLPLRALAVVILIAAAGGVALLTTKGKATVAFAREARTEVRKGHLADSPRETLHHADCGCGYHSNVTDPVGTGWYSGSRYPLSLA